MLQSSRVQHSLVNIGIHCTHDRDRIIRAKFSTRTQHDYNHIKDAYNINTVFNSYILDVFEKLFKQVSLETPLGFVQIGKEQMSVVNTRRY